MHGLQLNRHSPNACTASFPGESEFPYVIKSIDKSRLKETVPEPILVRHTADYSSCRGVNSITGSIIIEEAKKYLGIPYKYGGEGPNGFDCSGFTMFIYKKFGITLPRTAIQQATNGVEIGIQQAQAGDLVFFKTLGSKQINHVGIYMGNHNFIHANIKRGVTITSFDKYGPKVVTVKRLLQY